MPQWPLVICRAVLGDYETVRGLLDAAAQWLECKSTDQWAAPWPDEKGFTKRVQAAIEAGRTWIARDGVQPAATLTASPNDHGIWLAKQQNEPAVYIGRLVVSRQYSGHGLGGQLLDWAGLRAKREYGAHWIRVDVWTTNTELHDYYRDQGFEFCGLSPVPDYPSAALFQKAVDQIKPGEAQPFREDQGCRPG